MIIFKKVCKYTVFNSLYRNDNYDWSKFENELYNSLKELCKKIDVLRWYVCMIIKTNNYETYINLNASCFSFNWNGSAE